MIEKVVKSELLWPTPTLTVQLKNVQELNAGLARIIFEKEREVLSKGKPTAVAGVAEGASCPPFGSLLSRRNRSSCSLLS